MMAETFAPENQSLDVLRLDCDLSQEKQNGLAELAKLFSSDSATFEEVSKFYDKQVEKWSKRVLECTKVIQDNQHFYQEGRKVWMKDLATLTKALRNIKTAFEDTVQEVLAHTTSLERKLCEILNETAPYSKAQSDNLERRSELEQISSTFVLVKISAEIREKVREMAKFHAKIDSLLEGGELIKGIEIETSKTIAKVSKYLGAGGNTTEATHQHEPSEEGKSETRQHKQTTTRSNLTKASLSVQPVKDQKLPKPGLKPSEIIGKQGNKAKYKTSFMRIRVATLSRGQAIGLSIEKEKR